MALTRITKGVIKPNENYDTHNINSTGIVTAIGLDVNGNGDISGNLSVGGVLTYEDVTSIDSVGIITAQKDIHVGGGVSAVGVGTFGSLDIGGDIDVDGHTNLDNVSIAGVSTFSDRVTISGGKDLFMFDNGVIRLGNDSNTADFQMFHGGGHTRLNNSTGSLYINNSSTNGSIRLNPKDGENGLIVRYEGAVEAYHSNTKRIETTSTGAIVTGILTATDLDIDGHTNLDNVSIAGVTTITQDLDVDGHTNLDNVSITGITTTNQINISSSGPKITFSDTNENPDFYIEVNATQFLIQDASANAQRFRIQNSGTVDINGNTNFGGGIDVTGGPITATGDLDIDGHTNLDNVSISGVATVSGASLQLATADLVFLNNNHKIHNTSSAGNVTIQGGSTYAGGRIVLSGGYASGGGTGDIRFYADSTTTPVERARITSDGYVGIGTASIRNNRAMQLTGEDNSIFLITGHAPSICLNRDPDDSSDSDRSFFGVSSVSNGFANGTAAGDTIIRGNSTGQIMFATGTSVRSRITSNGCFVSNNIGMGADDRWKIRPNTSNTELAFEYSTSATLSDTNIKMYLDSNGRLIVGNTSLPSYAHANAEDLIIGNTNSGKRTGITLVSATDKDGNIHFSRGTSSSNNNIKGQIVYVHASGNATTADSLNFYTNADHRLRIDQNGDVFIGTTTDIAPTNGTNLCVSDGTIARLVLEKQSTRKFSLGAQDHFNIYDETASSERMKITSNGAAQFTGNDSSTVSHQFYNSNSGSGADTRLLIKTYSNQSADPYIKFDSGGSNHVVGQLYGGTTNNKLVLGVGESPSGGVSGIHIAGDGNTQVTNDISMTKGSDPRIYSGTNVGLNIDGMALYLNRYVNSSIAMGMGGGGVSVSNATSGNDAQFNIYKSTGSNSDKAILRVGYNADYCYSISRQRNSGSIVLNQTQAGGIAHHQNTGDDTMILTNRNSVHVAKFAPMVIQHAHTQSSASWGGSRPYKFVLRYSTGNFSGTYHVCRMISQHDWGHQDWEATVYHDYYSPSSSTGSTHRYTGYYGSHTDQVKHYNQQSSGSGTGNGNYLSTNQNLGPNGAFKIHESANGGYYRDAYATDYYVSLGNYSGVTIEIKINNPHGFLKDQATTLTDIYPASFNGQASQSDADSWSYGRGLWFNVRPGILDNSWWGYSSNFGQQTLPTS